MKTKISEDLTERSKYEAEEHAFDELLTQVMNEYNFEVPEGMIQKTINFFIEGLDVLETVWHNNQGLFAQFGQRCQ